VKESEKIKIPALEFAIKGLKNDGIFVVVGEPELVLDTVASC